MKDEGFWYWFSNIFESSHFKKGRYERAHWKQFIKDDCKIRPQSGTIAIDIEDLSRFPAETEIKNIDANAVIERRYKTVAKVGKSFAGDYAEAIRLAGFSLKESIDAIGIEFQGESDCKEVGVDNVDRFLQKIADVHKSKECGDYTVSLDLPEGRASSEQVVEGNLTVEIKKEAKSVLCNVNKAISGITLRLNAGDYDVNKAKALYELFQSNKSSDKERIYDLLFTVINSTYTFPSHLSSIKNRYETLLAQIMGRCVKKVAPLRERLSRLLSSYETTMNHLYEPAVLSTELKNKKDKGKRFYIFIGVLFLLSVLDLGLNYVTFDAVLQDKYQLLLWGTTIGYAVLLLVIAEVFVIMSPDYKDILSFRSLIFLAPLTLMLLTSGYMRYLYEFLKEGSNISGNISFDSIGDTAASNNSYKPLAVSAFFTFFSLLVFMAAVLLGYWHKYGSLSKFLNSFTRSRQDEKIKRYHKMIMNKIDAYYHERVNHLIQSSHTEIDEYINGFEYPASGEVMTEAEKREFISYLCWMKEHNKRLLKVEPGSQINDDDFHSLKNGLSEKMVHYLKIKNKAIAFKFGFDDAANGIGKNPQVILGSPFFHKDDFSLGVALSDNDINLCLESYSYGYAHGEKAVSGGL